MTGDCPLEGGDRDGLAAVDARGGFRRGGLAVADQPGLDLVVADVVRRRGLRRAGAVARRGPPWIETAKVRGPTCTRSPSFRVCRPGQRLAVDDRPVAAAQVADRDPVRQDGDLGVLAADLLAVGPQVTGLAAPDPEDGDAQGDDLPLRLAPGRPPAGLSWSLVPSLWVKRPSSLCGPRRRDAGRSRADRDGSSPVERAGTGRWRPPPRGPIHLILTVISVERQGNGPFPRREFRRQGGEPDRSGTWRPWIFSSAANSPENEPNGGDPGATSPPKAPRRVAIRLPFQHPRAFAEPLRFAP